MSEEQVMNQKEIGKRLTEIMRLHDISEKEIAMHLGRDETTIKRYKRGEIVIPAELGCYLRKKYRVDLNFLYNGEEPLEGIIEILESAGENYYEAQMERLRPYIVESIYKNFHIKKDK